MSIVYYGGPDVHQESIVAFLFSPETGVYFWDEVPNDRKHLERAAKRWRKRGELRLCYEASSAGFVVKRWLDELGIPCEVAAPAFIPKGPGDRIKTDRRDARRLAVMDSLALSGWERRCAIYPTVRVPSGPPSIRIHPWAQRLEG